MNGKETAHYLHFKGSKLQPGETPLLFLEGWIGEMMGKGKDLQHNGCFILTDKRAVFCRKGLLGEVFQAMPVEKIASVETRSSMGYRVLALHASHDALTFKTFESAALFEKVYNRIESLRAAAPVSSPAESATSPIDLIKKLGELRTAGLLSDEEFESKKRELLAKM